MSKVDEDRKMSQKRSILQMKKTFCIVLVLITLASLCGCSAFSVIVPAPGFDNIPIVDIRTPDSTNMPDASNSPDPISTPEPTLVPDPTHSSNPVVQAYDIDPEKPMLALTFDDGPSKKATARILDILEQSGARATFFVQGQALETLSDLVLRAYSMGCEIANHTKSHAHLKNCSDSEIQEEIGYVSRTVEKITGRGTSLFRPPYGQYNDHVLQMAGLPGIYWSVDTRDWETRDMNCVINEVIGCVQDGDIILMHDLYTSTADACEYLIPELIRQGYQLVTVSEMFAAKGIALEVGNIYRKAR